MGCPGYMVAYIFPKFLESNYAKFSPDRSKGVRVYGTYKQKEKKGREGEREKEKEGGRRRDPMYVQDVPFYFK